MKKLVYLIVLALILGLVLTGCSLLSNVGQTPATEQGSITYLTKNGPLPDLIGLWHFDGDALDSSGSGNTGTLVNGPLWEAGKFGQALSFDGVNDYVSVNDSISLSSIEDGGTWELWIKPNSDLRTGKWIGFLDTAPGLVGAVQFLVDPSNRLRACFGGVYGAMWSIDADWTGEWHHIAGTWNQKVNPTVTLYVDGVQKAQATVSVTVNVGLLDIGRLNNGNNFNGIIDEVRIYDYALLPGTIEDHAAGIYGFNGLLSPYAEPPRAFKMGSSIPLKWQYTDAAGNVVDSSAAIPPLVEIKKVTITNDDPPIEGDLIVVEDPGLSGLRYDTSTDMWIYNWQTKGLPISHYYIRITSTGQINGPFLILLR
ncbi:MAG: LamG domain-containing protein [Bacteroidetes bacterium]|nr:LamG domain-containing protein [Bacteroidota bacterium]